MKKEIPSAAEVITDNKFKQLYIKARLKAFSIFISVLTIAVAVPVVIVICKYAHIVWKIVF